MVLKNGNGSGFLGTVASGICCLSCAPNGLQAIGGGSSMPELHRVSLAKAPAVGCKPKVQNGLLQPLKTINIG